jgi:hypothetical protein
LNAIFLGSNPPLFWVSLFLCLFYLLFFFFANNRYHQFWIKTSKKKMPFRGEQWWVEIIFQNWADGVERRAKAPGCGRLKIQLASAFGGIWEWTPRVDSL